MPEKTLSVFESQNKDRKAMNQTAGAMSFYQLQSFRRPPTSKMSSSDIDSGRRDLSSFRSKGNIFKKNQYDYRPHKHKINEESDKENHR